MHHSIYPIVFNPESPFKKESDEMDVFGVKYRQGLHSTKVYRAALTGEN